MKTEDAIKVLWLLRVAVCETCDKEETGDPCFCALADAINAGIAALKKEFPLMVYHMEKRGDCTFRYDMCDNCGIMLDRTKYWGIKCCPNCGQRLEWNISPCQDV